MNKRTVMAFNHQKCQGTLEAAWTMCKTLEKTGTATVERGNDARVELIIALGGDGTTLEAIYIAQSQQVLLVGVNLGHVGFLARAEEENLEDLCRRVTNNDCQVRRRMCINAEIRTPDGKINTGWATNDIAVLSTDLGHLALLTSGVDGGAVSEYGADGLVVSAPTGPTAYNPSAGGPVVWSDVQILALSPLAAYGLFMGSLVLGSTAVLEIQVLPNQAQDCEVQTDDNRVLRAPPGTSTRATKSASDMQLVRLVSQPSSVRLVKKFDLPVEGWECRK